MNQKHGFINIQSFLLFPFETSVIGRINSRYQILGDSKWKKKHLLWLNIKHSLNKIGDKSGYFEWDSWFMPCRKSLLPVTNSSRMISCHLTQNMTWWWSLLYLLLDMELKQILYVFRWNRTFKLKNIVRELWWKKRVYRKL